MYSLFKYQTPKCWRFALHSPHRQTNKAIALVMHIWNLLQRKAKGSDNYLRRREKTLCVCVYIMYKICPETLL